MGHQKAVGILVDWQHKAGKSFGWIMPIYGVPMMPEAQHHGGDIYVHWKDFQDPRPGAVVSFHPYVDGQGLGAEDCQSRSVLRFIVAKDSKSSLTLPYEEVNPCASYLRSSIFYPQLEERGCTLRKYLWDGKYTVYELWGSPQAIIGGADEVGLLLHPTAEVLVSRQMARNEPPASLRDVEAADLPSVPPRFRVAMALGGKGDEETKKRLLGLIGA